MRLVGELEELRGRVARDAPAASLIEPERLQTMFLEPVQAELAAGRSLASLERPEDWWPAHEAAVFARLAAGDEKGVEELSAQARPKVGAQVAAIEAALDDLADIGRYVKLWEDRAAGGVDYWKRELERRAKALEKRITDLEQGGLDVPGMIASISTPPARGRLLATVSPQELATSPISSQGKWSTGVYTRTDPRAFVMSFPGRTASTPGDFCRVTFRVPRPEVSGKLHLQVHLTDEYDSDIWTRYRFYQLLHGGEVVWEEDIALTRRGGREWSSIDISGLGGDGEELELTLRVLDKRPVGNYATTIFIGPVRVVESL